MAFSLNDIISELETYSPLGIVLPRDSDTNEVKQDTIDRWAKDITQQINQRRSKTTLKEATIVLVEGVQDYSLPGDCRTVKSIVRNDGNPRPTREFGGTDPFMGGAFAGFGFLPTGQDISPSLDLIQRQQLRRVHQEDEWEMIGGKIRFNFCIAPDEKVRVVYEAIDRDFTLLPDDHFSLVIDYCRWAVLDWHIGKTGGFDDRTNPEGMQIAFRQRAELDDRVKTKLNMLAEEA